MRKILILGAASAIAKETALNFAKDGDWLYLVDITQDRLEATEDDILARCKTKISLDVMDATDFERHEPLFKRAIEKMGHCQTRKRLRKVLKRSLKK